MDTSLAMSSTSFDDDDGGIIRRVLETVPKKGTNFTNLKYAKKSNVSKTKKSKVKARKKLKKLKKLKILKVMHPRQSSDGDDDSIESFMSHPQKFSNTSARNKRKLDSDLGVPGCDTNDVPAMLGGQKVKVELFPHQDTSVVYSSIVHLKEKVRSMLVIGENNEISPKCVSFIFSNNV